MVSSVSSLNPLFLILINLSSILHAMFSVAEPLAKMFAGFSAESPYALFFCSSKSRTAFASSTICSAVVFISCSIQSLRPILEFYLRHKR